MKIRTVFQSKDVRKVCRDAFNIMGVNALPRELAREVASCYVRGMVRHSDNAYVSKVMDSEMDAIESEKDLAVTSLCF